MNAAGFSRLEYEILQEILTGKNERAISLAKSFGFIKENGELKRNRERQEFEEKLKKLKINIPWQ
jgi:hypothetical protein